MTIGNKECITGQCVSCTCSCTIAGGNACADFNVCQPSDEHKKN